MDSNRSSCWILGGVLILILFIAMFAWLCCAPVTPVKYLSMLSGAKNTASNRGPKPNMANIVRPPDQGKFNTLNPKKMYAAANVVPDETAGYQLSDCAFKNITANSKNDPILDVARMFPGVSAHQNMMQKIDAQTFPVSSTYPLALRQTALSAIDTRAGIASSSLKALKNKSGVRNQLRNGDGLFYGASANVGNQAAKNPALVGMVLNASDAWFTAASQGAGLTNQRVA